MVADTAPTCPRCGVKHPVPPGWGVFKILFAAFFVFVVFKTATHESTPAKEAAPEQIDYPSQARASCKSFVKRMANDPDSIDWVNALGWPISQASAYTWAVTMEFRAKNGFGALILNRKTCTVIVDGDSVRLVSMQ